MNLSNVVNLAAASEGKQLSADAVEEPARYDEEQFKLHIDEAEIHKSNKRYDEAQEELLHAMMVRATLDKRDTASMVDILQSFLSVATASKNKKLVSSIVEWCSKLESSLSESAGPTHLYLEGLHSVAKDYYSHNNNKFGNAVLVFVIDILKGLEGVEHARLLGVCYCTYGEAMLRDGLLKESIGFHQEALKVRRDVETNSELSHDSNAQIKQEVIQSLNCLGASLQAAMKLAEAESCFEEALLMREEHFKQDGPMIGMSHNDLAQLLRCKKEYEKAITHHISAIEIFSQSLSPDHPLVVNAKGEYGVTLNYQSRTSFEAGSSMVKEALAYLIANKYPADHEWMKKFNEEVLNENVHHELAACKKKIKHYQTAQVLKEIDERLQAKKYEQLQTKLRNQESEFRNEMNKIKFMNSVQAEQLAMNKSTTENILIENNDLVQKIEDLVAKQKASEAEYQQATAKMQVIFDELLANTEVLEAKDARFQAEESRLLDEIDNLTNRDDERLTEIEDLEGRVWELEKKLKVVSYQNDQLMNELGALKKEGSMPRRSVPTLELDFRKDSKAGLKPVHNAITESKCDSDVEKDAVLSQPRDSERIENIDEVEETKVVASLKSDETTKFLEFEYPVVTDSHSANPNKVATDSDVLIQDVTDDDKNKDEKLSELVKSDRPDSDCIEGEETDIEGAMFNTEIVNLTVSLKLEEIISATAFALLEDAGSIKIEETEAAERKHCSEVDELTSRLSALTDELQDSREIILSNNEELQVLRSFMKEHDLDPKNTKQKALKAKCIKLEDEVQEMSYKIDDLESSLYSLQNDYDQSIADNEEYKRTTLEATDSNRLLMLQLKAANYEIEHMSAELHVDRGKMGELESALQARTMELDEISDDLSKCRDNCRAQGVTIENRNKRIESLENEILDLKGIPRILNPKDAADVSKEKGTKEDANENYYEDMYDEDEEVGMDEGGKEEEKDVQNSFLTDLLVDEVEAPPQPEPSPGRAVVLPALDVAPKPDEKSFLEGSPRPSPGIRFLEPLSRASSSHSLDGEVSTDFAEVLFIGPPRTPKDQAAIKRDKHTKNKDKNLRIQLRYCTMCDNKIKGQPKVIPTSLQNVLQPGQSYESVAKSGEGSTKEFQLAGFPKSSKNYLDSQVIWRETYSTRGADCIFCSWDCARVWNKKHTPANFRYNTQKLIDIAAGKFIS